MRFEKRELTSYAQPVSMDSLKEGQVYFSVQYVDEDLLVPTIETLVFVGMYLGPDRENRLRFQDAESYRRGVRYASPAAKQASFHTAAEGGASHIFEFEQALDELKRCALRRRAPRP